MMRCDVVWCGVVWCGAMRCGAVRSCAVEWCRVVRRDDAALRCVALDCVAPHRVLGCEWLKEDEVPKVPVLW